VGIDSVDIAVVGGGVVGAAMAAALASLAPGASARSLKVALVDARAATANSADIVEPRHYDTRVSSLHAGSINFLTRIGAWPLVASERVADLVAMEVFDARGGGHVRFDAADLAEPRMVVVAENRNIERALYRRLGALAADGAQVRVYRPDAVRDITTQHGTETSLGGRVKLTLDSGTLFTRLVIGADGANSTVRALAGVPADVGEYDQTALVATLDTRQGMAGMAYQWFLDSGPVALLPLPGRSTSLVWSTDPERAPELMALSDGAFIDELSAVAGRTVPGLELVAKRQSFALRRIRALQYTAPRIALAGDAAHTVHPLAGQGVNLGLMDAAALAESIFESFAAMSDPGDVRVLRRYELRRKLHNQAMQFAIDGFDGVFRKRQAVLATLRSGGFSLVNSLAPARAMITRYAMGLGPDAPRFAR
jgi:ubiquinone biosynthesis UbiH/UbiF/VisC/COQ6 family hydroxylase